MMDQRPGVTFLVPVHNGARWLDDVLDAIQAQADGRPMEILVVEDGSTDDSAQILVRRAAGGEVRVIPGPRRGATAALNEGLRHAAHPVICQVDQDVIIQPGWMRTLVGAVNESDVGAAQGYYVAPRQGTIWARVMGLDLEHRYQRLQGGRIDHVCTGNTAYRASALRAVGGFDESLGYGYDNDISYRLSDAGYRLTIRPDARSEHRWRDGWWTYMVQQYGFGYGRLDLVAKHRGRIRGDTVSPLSMMLHAPLAAAAVALGVLALLLALGGYPARVPAGMALAIVAVLAAERVVAGLQVRRRFRDSAGFWFAPVHLVRDLAWVAALAMWSGRRLSGTAPRPSASMRPRAAAPVTPSGRPRNHLSQG